MLADKAGTGVQGPTELSGLGQSHFLQGDFTPSMITEI